MLKLSYSCVVLYLLNFMHTTETSAGLQVKVNVKWTIFMVWLVRRVWIIDDLYNYSKYMFCGFSDYLGDNQKFYKVEIKKKSYPKRKLFYFV